MRFTRHAPIDDPMKTLAAGVWVAAFGFAAGQCGDKCLELAFGDGAHKAVHGLAVLEGIDGGDRLDAQRLRQVGVLVDIDLGQLDPVAAHRRGGLLDWAFVLFQRRANPGPGSGQR